ncbi:hypothetical protein ACJX0J_033098, partial [Zea mays]
MVQSLLSLQILSPRLEILVATILLFLASCMWISTGFLFGQRAELIGNKKMTKEYVIVEGAHLSLNFVVHISQVIVEEYFSGIYSGWLIFSGVVFLGNRFWTEYWGGLRKNMVLIDELEQPEPNTDALEQILL